MKHISFSKAVIGKSLFLSFSLIIFLIVNIAFAQNKSNPVPPQTPNCGGSQIGCQFTAGSKDWKWGIKCTGLSENPLTSVVASQDLKIISPEWNKQSGDFNATVLVIGTDNGGKGGVLTFASPQTGQTVCRPYTVSQ